ncbi:hypothetical protein BCIN_12g04790 [Botrytis cinerea B05.10]|uniref:DUF6604 domain-containing protein n=1 Tax=Botryotinia fuckeliana (strain B05.10) TaxID=332648 RepID=A0A384JZI4_BOTFB|nr:hypothetical protein BCIN_12g04790 [Botrytis cinerea B05.10]ATZ55932.1 hypothetical protein BCIN_12g04790 [Botrytis cinerea B05.10]
MLTDDLASSYSSCKADTSMFTKWLFKSAKACGYEMPKITTSTIEDVSIPIPILNTQPRLKGKARKLAKLEKESREKKKAQETVPVSRSPSKYTITTTEILKQAKLVTGKIEFPQKIRKVLQRKKYKNRNLDLLSATSITNTAFEIVRRSEQEILNGAPKLFSKKRSYDAIAAVIFYANGLNTGKDPTQKMELKELLRPTPFDDFIYLSTSRILMKYENLCEMNPTFPIPSLPLRAVYIPCPEILGTPYMDKKEKEDVLLSQLFIDLDLFNTYNRLTKEDESENSAVCAPPAPDALTAGLLRLKNEGQISVTVVFAAQIFLDLNEILGDDITEGHKDWGKLAWKDQSSLDSSGL